MSLKRSFIQMSITKQIYCGLFGMAVLTCTNVFILIFCTSLILTNILNQSVNNELEHIDNNMMNIYAQFADVTGVLFLDPKAIGKKFILMPTQETPNETKPKLKFLLI